MGSVQAYAEWEARYPFVQNAGKANRHGRLALIGNQWPSEYFLAENLEKFS